MCLRNLATGEEICRYDPGTLGPHTALIMCRIARAGNGWSISSINGSDHTARDFGSLVPELQM